MLPIRQTLFGGWALLLNHDEVPGCVPAVIFCRTFTNIFALVLTAIVILMVTRIIFAHKIMLDVSQVNSLNTSRTKRSTHRMSLCCTFVYWLFHIPLFGRVHAAVSERELVSWNQKPQKLVLLEMPIWAAIANLNSLELWQQHFKRSMSLWRRRNMIIMNLHIVYKLKEPSRC